MESLRILHTGDWRLNLPCEGIAYYPENLMKSLSNAAIESVERVVSFAIGEMVDVMVVGGNTLNPLLAGPADFAFLLMQLERLESAEIPVIWNWSWDDRRNQWPRCFKWPSNIYQIIGDTPQTITLDIKDKGPVSFIGIELTTSQSISLSWFDGLHSEPPVFGVGYGLFSDDDLNSVDPNHWLVSGTPYGVSQQDGKRQSYHAGSPQGRSLDETGPHGAALLEYSLNGEVDYQFINTSRVEYESISIDVSGVKSGEFLITVAEQQLASRTFDPSIIYLIELILTNSNCDLHSLPFVESYEALRSNLQDALTKLSPGIVLSRISPNPVECDGRSFEEELLSEFLFVTAELKEQGWQTLNLGIKVPDQHDACWTELRDDISGLRTILAVESLGEHLLGRQDKDAA